jgi:hypothetical protein
MKAFFTVFLFVKDLTGLPVNMAMLELLPAPVEPTQMTQDSLLLYRELARPRCRKGEESATLAPAIYTPRRRGVAAERITLQRKSSDLYGHSSGKEELLGRFSLLPIVRITYHFSSRRQLYTSRIHSPPRGSFRIIMHGHTPLPRGSCWTVVYIYHIKQGVALSL